MEKINNVFEHRNINLFNTPLEVGLRMLYVLNTFKSIEIDMNTLVIFDYLLLNSNDFPQGPKSIHPSIPHRSTQMIIKPPILREGLNLMISKDLIDISFTDEGIKYKANELTGKIIELLDNTYSKQLLEISFWIKKQFGNYDFKKLDLFVKNNIPNWGSEFIYESLIREHEQI
jgi:hypothetical protein